MTASDKKYASQNMLKAFFNILKRSYKLALPYGRKKLFLIFSLIIANGIIQIIGVTSVLPFFALAAAPDTIRESRIGSQVLKHFSHWNHNELLIVAGCFSILMLFLANAVTLSSEIIRLRYGHGLGHFLRSKMLDSLSYRPYRFFLNTNTGILIQKIQGEINQFINSVFLPMMEACSRMVTLFLLTLTIFLVNPTVAISTVIFLSLFYTIIFLALRKRSAQLGKEMKHTFEGMNVSLIQFLCGIKPVFVQNKSQYFINQYLKSSAKQARIMPLAPIYNQTPRYLIEPLAFGGLVLIVVIMASQGKDFSSILPQLTVMAFAAYRILPNVQLLYAQLTRINTGRYVIADIESEYQALDEIIASGLKNKINNLQELKFEKSIKIDNLHFSYSGAKDPIFENFSIQVPLKSSIGIIGSTGTGKSTLVDIILGLHTPEKGTIYVDDTSITRELIPSWRKLIGYVPQDIYLLDESIIKNIAFGCPDEEINFEQVESAAKAAQIYDFIENDLPQKWETQVGERGVRVSGGQRQRIGLARALYQNPQVLILDEATSALDTETEAEVMKAIEALKGQLTLIIIAHRLSTIENCDSVVNLNELRDLRQ